MKRSLSVMLIAAFVVLGTTSPALADPKIGFSSDGSTFAESLPAPLFSSDLRWVPGDERTRTFYVQNRGAQRAVIDVDFVGEDVDGLLATGDLTVAAGADGRPMRTTTADGTHRLVSDVEIPAAGVSRIDVAVTFDPTSGNVSQLRAMAFDFQVRLTEDGVLAAGGERSEGAGILPGTGSESSLLVLLAAVSSVLVGSAVVTRARCSSGASS